MIASLLLACAMYGNVYTTNPPTTEISPECILVDGGAFPSPTETTFTVHEGTADITVTIKGKPSASTVKAVHEFIDGAK